METDNRVLIPDRHKKDEKVHCYLAVPLVACICLIVGLTILALFQLPTPLGNDANPGEFIGERAQRNLEQLTSLGPRPTGSVANEVFAVQFLRDKIKEIISESNGLYNIETDIQVASGGHSTFGYPSLYESIQNVIVKLTPKGSTLERSLLVNSHFDSVVGAPGAGDDGSMVVCMLEVLGALTKSKDAVRHPLIFLFNGDEENGLQASHAFITQHKWASTVRGLINLEGMGVGGKEILFQSGPGNNWMVDSYVKSAKYPFASVLGEEAFENRLIPSDTDYTILNRVANLSGLNFAYIDKGYLYHTPLDSIENVEIGTLQHTGDNLLALVKAVANSEKLSQSIEIEETGKQVYFDVFGLFMINYYKETGTAVNYTISVLSLIAVCLSMWLITRKTKISLSEISVQFWLSLGVQLGSLAIAAGVVIGLSYFYDAIGYSMSWFSQQWLIIGLYFCPFIFILGIFPLLFLGWRSFSVLPLGIGIQLFLHSQSVILAVIIIVLAEMNIRSTFLATNVLMFYVISLLINLSTGLHAKPYLWAIPVLICQAIPLAFTSYIMEIIFSVYIPVTGRSASNPETMIAYLSIVSCVLMFGFIIPIFGIFRNSKLAVSSILIVFIVFFILIFTSVGFPYTPRKPQRQSVYHTQRTRYNASGAIIYRDSLYYMDRWDRHSLETLQGVANRNGLSLHSDSEDGSGLRYFSNAYWTEAPSPKIQNPSVIQLVSKSEVGSKMYKYTLKLIGRPTKYGLMIAANNGGMLTDWSFASQGPPPNTRKQQVVYIQFGKDDSLPYTFSLTLRVADSSNNALSIGLVTVYSEMNEYTEDFRDFVHSFPIWTSVQSARESYDWYIF